LAHKRESKLLKCFRQDSFRIIVRNSVQRGAGLPAGLRRRRPGKRPFLLRASHV